MSDSFTGNADLKFFQPASFDGFGILSRVNSIFTEDAGGELRRAILGYNVKAVPVFAAARTATNTQIELMFTAMFACDDIPAGTELRMDYEYNDTGEALKKRLTPPRLRLEASETLTQYLDETPVAIHSGMFTQCATGAVSRKAKAKAFS